MQLREQDVRNLFLDAGAEGTHSGRSDDRAGDQPELLRAGRIEDHVHGTQPIALNPLYRLFVSNHRLRISPYNC
jgi:hypothetical protein